MGDDDQAPLSPLINLSADIVSAYVSKNSVPVGDLANLIAAVHAALERVAAPPAPEPEKLTPPVPIRKTVTPDYIVSLEDGKPYKSLKRHLTTRGLTPDQYRQKWGLPPDYPMVAATYAAQRSELAKSLGLGQIRRDRAAAARLAAEASQAGGEQAPARRGRPRKSE
ncbi:MucR family transcriptional regulator [Methylobacterium aquaticum]|uniref:MucR family transcriptional regulator n=1 Tax=Methylobacterium aquaticum TaxID=270351 RepID=A0A0J6VGU3_9HYPH|nr:MucR family transcriptional regulator [Methylobacterium aquaticum]KMO38281.1 MucR family transcriptional regulator [Methylobacterium aquaticum]